MRTAVGLIGVVFLGCLTLSQAQEKKVSGDPAVYRVEFDVHDASQGAAHPRQHYAMVIDESRRGSFQAGNRIPAADSAPEGPYLDIGVKVECSVRESVGKVALEGSLELSNVDGVVSLGGKLNEPIVGQRKIAFQRTLEPGSPTVIVSDPKYKVEATVTRL